MKLRLRRTKRRRAARGPSYPIRPRSFVASLGVHGIIIALLVLVPSARVTQRRPIYTELIEPEAEKIVWRNLREPLPHVSAPEKIGTSDQPRGVQFSKRVLIATSPQARSETQFIWQPVPKIEIRQDLPLPNLVSRVNLPAPPPPEEPKTPPPEAQPNPARPAKTFVPPTRTPSPTPPPAQVAIPDAPAPSVAVALPTATVVSAAKSLVPRPPRPVTNIVPPSPTSRPAPVASPVAIPDAPAPSMAVSNVPSAAVLNAANSVVPLPPRPAKAFGSRLPEPSGSAPASSPVAIPDAPVAISALAATVIGSAKGVALPPPPPPSPGNGTAELAIASLHPAERTGPLPGGARPGQFSAAPTTGATSTGEVSGIAVPNLTLRDATPSGTGVTRPDPSVSRPDQTRTIREEPPKAAGAMPPRTILYS